MARYRIIQDRFGYTVERRHWLFGWFPAYSDSEGFQPAAATPDEAWQNYVAAVAATPRVVSEFSRPAPAPSK